MTRLAIIAVLALVANACVTDPCVASCEDSTERAWECGASEPACFGSESDMKECRMLCSDPEVRALDSRTDTECEASLVALDTMTCEEILDRYQE